MHITLPPDMTDTCLFIAHAIFLFYILIMMLFLKIFFFLQKPNNSAVFIRKYMSSTKPSYTLRCFFRRYMFSTKIASYCYYVSLENIYTSYYNLLFYLFNVFSNI